MPLYEYNCPDCLTEFDVLRSMSKADTPLSCPECASTGPKRKLSRFAAMSKRNGGESHSIAGSGGCGNCSGGSCSGSCSGCSHH
ncbi:MAG TPA: zinc ribbon domain-containing protein [Anaerolineae bacterium]|nr:zinc ribbon domain-containing protein [Anaerolineae bacterium]